MAGQPELITSTSILGLIFIIVGLLLMLAPLLLRVFEGLDRIHPLILVGFRLDGVFIGTSPIVILALIIIYLLLRFSRG